MSEYKTLFKLWQEHGVKGEMLHCVDEVYGDSFFMIDCGEKVAIGYQDNEPEYYLSNIRFKLAPKPEVRLFPAIVKRNKHAAPELTSFLYPLDTNSIRYPEGDSTEFIRLATPDDLQNGIKVDWK